MRDSDLITDPNNWLPSYGPSYGCSAKQEISCGTSEALQSKLRYIDHKIADLENKGDFLIKHAGAYSQRIANLSAWYELIEVELIKRGMINDLKVTIEKDLWFG